MSDAANGLTPGPYDLCVAGVEPFSTVDYPGQLAAVVFLQGCPWRCAYCHNPHLQATGPGDGLRWFALLDWLRTRVGRLDAVVFSGGEPTLDPALPAALLALRALGFKLGLHTAGLAPRRLADVLPHVDWVGLDVKASLGDSCLHARITGRAGSHRSVQQSLAVLSASSVAYEVRSTIHPRWFSDADVLQLVQDHRKAPSHVLQVARLRDAQGRPALPPDYPSTALLSAARAIRPDLVLRR